MYISVVCWCYYLVFNCLQSTVINHIVQQFIEEGLLTTIGCYLTKMHLIKGGTGLVTILDDMFGTEGTMDFLKDNFFEVVAEFSCEYL